MALETNEKQQYEMRLIAPHLKKPGIALYGIEKGKTLKDLSNEGIITPQLLKEFGFIIVYDYDPAIDHEEGEEDIGATFYTQFPHRDGNTQNIPPVVSLRYTNKMHERNGYTSIGVAEEVWDIITRHLSSLADSDVNKVNWIIEDLRKELLRTGTDLSNEKAIGQNKNWMDFTFENEIKGYPEIKKLYRLLKKKTYQILNSPNTLIVFDNINMVHSGVYTGRKLKVLEEDPQTILFRRFLDWDKGTLIPIT